MGVTNLPCPTHQLLHLVLHWFQNEAKEDFNTNFETNTFSNSKRIKKSFILGCLMTVSPLSMETTPLSIRIPQKWLQRKLNSKLWIWNDVVIRPKLHGHQKTWHSIPLTKNSNGNKFFHNHLTPKFQKNFQIKFRSTYTPSNIIFEILPRRGAVNWGPTVTLFDFLHFLYHTISRKPLFVTKHSCNNFFTFHL